MSCIRVYKHNIEYMRAIIQNTKKYTNIFLFWFLSAAKIIKTHMVIYNKDPAKHIRWASPPIGNPLYMQLRIEQIAAAKIESLMSVAVFMLP